MNEIEIDTKLASALFYYDPNSPTGLRYKKDNGGRGIKKRKAHDVAGYLDKEKGYFSVAFNGKAVRVHRVVLVLHGFSVTGKQVDHIDGNRQNNRFENLRLADAVANARNQKPRSTNKTGVVGVSLNNSNRGQLYKATAVGLDSKLKSGSFSVRKYGQSEAFRLAVEWRINMISELNRQNAGYTNRHIGIEKTKGRV